MLMKIYLEGMRIRVIDFKRLVIFEPSPSLSFVITYLINNNGQMMPTIAECCQISAKFCQIVCQI